MSFAIGYLPDTVKFTVLKSDLNKCFLRYDDKNDMAFISKGKFTSFVHYSKRKGLMLTTESVNHTLFFRHDTIVINNRK